MARDGGSHSRVMASGMLMCLFATLILTGCGFRNQADDVLRGLQGVRASSDDVVNAARTAPGGLPTTLVVSEEAARLADGIVNDYTEFSAELACEAYKNRRSFIGFPSDLEAEELLKRMQQATTEPDDRKLIEIGCLVLEFWSSAQM